MAITLQRIKSARQLLLESDRIIQATKSTREYHKGVLVQLAETVKHFASTRFFKGKSAVDTLYDQLDRFTPASSQDKGKGFSYAIALLDDVDDTSEISTGDCTDLREFLRIFRLYLQALQDAMQKGA
jgi:hypothetical protein